MSILFPPNPKGQIVESDDARNLISQIAKSESSYLDSGHDKLTVAYKRLWEANSRLRHKDLQPRLFQLVLCAFDDLTLNQLTEALRIDPGDMKRYRTDLQPKHVEWLCHNFLEGCRARSTLLAAIPKFCPSNCSIESRRRKVRKEDAQATQKCKSQVWSLQNKDVFCAQSNARSSTIE